MGTYNKYLLLVGSGSMYFLCAAIHPTLFIYFTHLIGSDVLALANIIQLGLGAIISSTIQSKKCLNWYRRHFTFIVAFDCLGFAVISLESVAYPYIRFIGMAILEAVSTTLWMLVLKNAINRLINGDALTEWDSLKNTVDLAAGLTGGVIAILFSEVFVNYIQLLLILQAFGNLFSGVIDIIVYKRLSLRYQKQVVMEKLKTIAEGVKHERE